MNHNAMSKRSPKKKQTNSNRINLLFLNINLCIKSHDAATNSVHPYIHQHALTTSSARQTKYRRNTSEIMNATQHMLSMNHIYRTNERYIWHYTITKPQTDRLRLNSAIRPNFRISEQLINCH